MNSEREHVYCSTSVTCHAHRSISSNGMRLSPGYTTGYTQHTSQYHPSATTCVSDGRCSCSSRSTDKVLSLFTVDGSLVQLRPCLTHCLSVVSKVPAWLNTCLPVSCRCTCFLYLLAVPAVPTCLLYVYLHSLALLAHYACLQCIFLSCTCFKKPACCAVSAVPVCSAC